MEGLNFSRIADLLIAPGNLGILLLAAGLALQLTRFRRAGRTLLSVVAITAVAIAVLPIGQWFAAPLEVRFPRPERPPCVDGVVILSSGEQPILSRHYGQPIYFQNEGAVLAGAELARRYPKAKLVFSGGSGAPFGPHPPAASVAQMVFDGLGLDASRILYEQRSRNTWENLVFTRELVHPQPGETWLLVAAALHMPRAMAVAQLLGWPMVPWPTDYRTLGDQGTAALLKFSRSLLVLDDAVHEWLGLLAYRLSGKSEALLPARMSNALAAACK